MSGKTFSRSPLHLFAMLALVLAPRTAFAHHALGGITPRTFAEGFLSGLAHPVIGLDHLVFVLLAGAYAGLLRQRSAPIAFILAAIPGCLLCVHGFDLPFSEKVLAGSLLVAGLLAGATLRLRAALNAALFAACGVLHGYAYGEAIVGSQPAPLAAYLIGFTLIQLAIAGALAWFVWRATSTGSATLGAQVVRVLAACSALAGLFLMLR